MPTHKLPLFSHAVLIRLAAHPEKTTEECFPASTKTQRGNRLTNILPALQPQTGACTVAVLKVQGKWSPSQAAAAVLGLRLHEYPRTRALDSALMQRGHLITLSQAASLMARLSEWKNVSGGIHAEDEGAFFFTSAADKAFPVSTCYAYRNKDCAHAHSIPFDSREKSGPAHLFVRALALSKLAWPIPASAIFVR